MSKIDLNNMDGMYFDILSEIGNIGAGNALDQFVPAQTHDGQKQGRNHGQKHRNHGQEQRIADPLQEVWAVFRQEREVKKGCRRHFRKEIAPPHNRILSID